MIDLRSMSHYIDKETSIKYFLSVPFPQNYTLRFCFALTKLAFLPTDNFRTLLTSE